jgi:cell division protease FtsH
MDFKRIFRGPILYIVIAVVVVWVGSSLLTGSGFRQVTTQQGLELLKGDNVQAVKIIDGDNRVDITLQKPDADLGKQVQFYYVTPRSTRPTRRRATTTRCPSPAGCGRPSASCCRCCSSAPSSG